MKKLLFLVFTSLMLFSAVSQTVIHDKQEVYGKWTPKGSPYIVNGEAIVPAGKTLKIKPGVVVRFKTGDVHDYDKYSRSEIGFLRVNGRLVAKGSEDNLIYFTRDGAYGNWGVIYMNTGNKDNLLMYCKVEYAYFIRSIIPTDNATAGISFNACSGAVLNCLVVNNGWNGINCKNSANPVLMNNTLVGNKYAIECNTSSTPTIINTIFYSNDESFYINGGAKPLISYSLLQNALPLDVSDLGNNIIGLDPKFVDRWNGNFRLQDDSPCIGKGKGGKNMGAY